MDPFPIRHTAKELSPYLLLSTGHRYTIRSARDFVSTSPDLRQQVLDLIDHLYVRYPVPLFLYRAMLSKEGLRLVFDESAPNDDHLRVRWETTERHWFRAIALGDSFADLVKDRLNRREAHWFLQAPAQNSVRTNLKWAKAAALGLPWEACEFFFQRFEFRDLSPARFSETVRFYARTWAEFAPHERSEISDFLGHCLSLSDPEFSLAGRTAASVRRLSEAWHRRYFGEDETIEIEIEEASWRGALSPWETVAGAGAVRAVELTQSGDLAQESAIQRHCVASYVEKCRSGESRIASLRWFDADGEREIARLTVEIDVATRRVVQIRGRYNRSAAPEEWSAIRLWAEAQGLGVAERA